MKSSPKRKKLPKQIRDELRMTVALQAFSHIKGGKGKTTKMQNDAMFSYYHGVQPHRPSQIQMLCDGNLRYHALYKYEERKITNKDAPLKHNLVLKSDLSLDLNNNYGAGKEINVRDLEKKLLSGPLLITGRSLRTMAQKGMKNFKKALAFAYKKWDRTKNSPKDSGDTVDDVIEYVRTEMYKEMHVNPTENDSDTDEDEEIENSTQSNNLNESMDLESNDKENGGDTTVSDGKDNSNNDDNDKEDDGVSSRAIIDDDVEIPSDWFFPSFISFVLFGPFVEDKNRLALFEEKEAPKGTHPSRSQKRKLDEAEKNCDRANDNSNDRGYSTDQKISIEGLRIQKLNHVQTTNESNLVALIAHESAIARQVDAAERRATVRCKKYDPNNVHWKHVDTLLEEQAELTRNIKTFTRSIKPVSLDNDLYDLTGDKDDSKKASKSIDQIDISNDDKDKMTNNEGGNVSNDML